MENRDSLVTNVVIMKAAGRDFHNFNVVFRANPKYRVVAFTKELAHSSRTMAQLIEGVATKIGAVCF